METIETCTHPWSSRVWRYITMRMAHVCYCMDCAKEIEVVTDKDVALRQGDTCRSHA